MKKLIIASLILLSGCTDECDLTSSTGQVEMYYCSNVESVPGEMYKVVYEDYYYNLYFDSNVIIEHNGNEYQSVEELMELIELIGPGELFDLGYRMERIIIGEMHWDKNY